jgi:type IV pilus assembly protein PilE
MNSVWFAMRAARPPDTNAQGGFNLIELMIVVTILAILATLANVAWRDHLIDVRRTEATATLLRAAAAQESYFSAVHRYATEPWLPMPDGLAMSRSENEWYELSVESSNMSSFVMAARPTQGSSQTADKHCQIFTIDQIGRRDSAPSPPSVCWR